MASSKTLIEEDRLPGVASDRERVFDAFRQWGYLEADLDPLGFLHPQTRPELRIEGEHAEAARRVYCCNRGRGVYAHCGRANAAAGSKRAWKARSRTVDQEHVLDQLIRADLFEQVIQQRYLGNKRFSLEGVTALIPLVDEIIEAAGEYGRGRTRDGHEPSRTAERDSPTSPSALRKKFSPDLKTLTRAACWAAAT